MAVLKPNRSEQKTESEVHRLKRKSVGKYCGRLPLFLIMASAAVMLAACGQEEAVSTDVQTQVVSVDVQEPNMEGRSVPSQEATASPDAYYLEMDEETREQLMTELLEENEMDMSVVESKRSTRACTFDLPEGFEESQDVDHLYVTARYPLDTSMIYYEVMEGDISLQMMTEDFFKDQAKEGLYQTYGVDIELNIDSYKSVKIDGYPAFRILCHYEVDGIKITQLEYIINADKTYVVTYSQTSDYDRMEEYEASAATIHVK